TCVALFFFKERPVFALALGWLLFAVNASDMWFHSSEEKSLAWFLYQHSLELLFLAVAHVGYLFVLRARRGKMGAVTNQRSL
ncbi:MAG: hypothetical protein ACLP7O_06555, partial [Terracidiphilus sp.]